MATNMSDTKWETVTRKKNATAAEKKAARKVLADTDPIADLARKLISEESFIVNLNRYFADHMCGFLHRPKLG